MTETRLSQTRRGAIAAALVTVAGAASIAASARAAAPDMTELSGDVHDFDYYTGDWTVTNRRLKKRWTANPEWEEFLGKTSFTPYLGGVANVSESVFPTKGFAGLTVRVFDPEHHLWSIYWINGSNATDLGPPMIGGFRGNVGEFRGDDTDDGKPIKVRVIRTKLPPGKERWEQAFSQDGGTTWETNWTADFTRATGR